MDIQDYQSLTGKELEDRIRALPREVLDEQIRQFGAQYAFLCQRLEALYTPDRTAVFMAIRPGGLEEIDRAIQKADPAHQKELTLLKSFRDLNRVLLPFMDVFEEHTLTDLKYMSREELETLLTGVSGQLSAAEKTIQGPAANDRSTQNASGTLRLATLMKDRIHHELKERFGVIIREVL